MASAYTFTHLHIYISSTYLLPRPSPPVYDPLNGIIYSHLIDFIALLNLFCMKFSGFFLGQAELVYRLVFAVFRVGKGSSRVAKNETAKWLLCST